MAWNGALIRVLDRRGQQQSAQKKTAPTFVEAVGKNAIRAKLLVDRVLEALAGLELGLVRGRNLDFRAGGRVAASRGLALRHGEGAETNQTNFVASLERGRDCLEHCVNSFGGLSLGDRSLVGNDANQIVLVHCVSSQ